MEMTTEFWRPYSNKSALVRHLIPDVKFTLPVCGELELRASLKKHLYLFRGNTLQKEVETAKILASYVPVDGVIYDVGANIGLYSLVFALNRKRRVVAFEPFHLALSYLHGNIRRNNLSNIEVHSIVLADRTGTCRFTYDPVTLYTSHISAEGEQGVELPSADLDSYIESASLLPPDLIKMDVEGADTAILLGMKRCLQQYKPIVFLEGGIRDERDRIVAISFLKDLGFSIWNLRRTEQLLDTTSEYEFLAIPR